MAIDDSLERARLHPDVLKNLNKNKKLKIAEAYSEDNPPPYPVTSVNGQTGDVEIQTVDLPVSVQDGGTGADNAADAITNLGLGNVGNVVVSATNSSVVTVPSNETTEIASLYLPAGLWLVMGNANWVQNGEGYRQIVLSTTTPSLNPSRNVANTTMAISSQKETYQQIVMRSRGGITMKLWGHHNASASQIVYPYLCAIAFK